MPLDGPLPNNTHLEIMQNGAVVGHAFATAGTAPVTQVQRWVLHKAFVPPPDGKIVLMKSSLAIATLSDWKAELNRTPSSLWLTDATYVKVNCRGDSALPADQASATAPGFPIVRSRTPLISPLAADGQRVGAEGAEPSREAWPEPGVPAPALEGLLGRREKLDHQVIDRAGVSQNVGIPAEPLFNTKIFGTAPFDDTGTSYKNVEYWALPPHYLKPGTLSGATLVVSTIGRGVTPLASSISAVSALPSRGAEGTTFDDFLREIESEIKGRAWDTKQCTFAVASCFYCVGWLPVDDDL